MDEMTDDRGSLGGVFYAHIEDGVTKLRDQRDQLLEVLTEGIKVATESDYTFNEHGVVHAETQAWIDKAKAAIAAARA